MLIFKDHSSFQHLTFTDSKDEGGTKHILTMGRARWGDLVKENLDESRRHGVNICCCRSPKSWYK